MRVERAGDLVFVSYFMIDWNREKQSASGRQCTQCGREMNSLEATVRTESPGYEGLVCHNCKRVTWVRRG